MSDCEDLYQRAKAKPQSLRFDEAIELAGCFGFFPARQRGTSHLILKREGYMQLLNFQPTSNGMAKAYQVRQLLRAIDDLKGRGEA